MVSKYNDHQNTFASKAFSFFFFASFASNFYSIPLLFVNKKH